MFVFVVSFFMYLLLSRPGGINIQEVTIAFLLASVVSFAAPDFSRSGFWSMKGLNPRRWWDAVRFLFGPFALALWDANWDMAKRALTGEINPGIVKFDPRLRTDKGRMMLAGFITLTPGTLTVDIDDDGVFYVHVINLTSTSPPEAEICGTFAKWARRIAE